MKKLLLVLIVMSFLPSSICYGQPPPDSTRSIDATTLASIQNALDNDLFLEAINSIPNPEEEDGPGGSPDIEAENFGFYGYRKDVFKFVFKNDSLPNPTRTGIIDFPISETIQTYFKDPAISGHNRGLSLAYLLINYATITDLLWYYSDIAYAAALQDSSAILAAFADMVPAVTEPWGEPPQGINFSPHGV
jgi:hypothetical protein